jgi:hypothetical protein
MNTSRQFFELQSARDMLEKARREFSRLQSDLSTDNVFNFFVTAYHIKDYAKEVGIPESQFLNVVDFQLCKKLCNMAKHLADHGKYKDNKHSVESVKLWNDGLWEDGLWDCKEAKFIFEGNQLDILQLAERVLNICDSILTRYGV